MKKIIQITSLSLASILASTANAHCCGDGPPPCYPKCFHDESPLVQPVAKNETSSLLKLLQKIDKPGVLVAQIKYSPIDK